MLNSFTFIVTVFVNFAPRKRIYDQKNSCFYCKKQSSKLARNLEQMHKDKEEVKVALSFPIGDRRRKQELTKIRKMGNINHIMAVLEANKGELKVDRRPIVNIDPTMYLPCKECHGFFLKHELPRHATTCISREDGTSKKPCLKQLKYEGKLLLANVHTKVGCSPQLRENVLSKMISDETTAVAQSDRRVSLVEVHV